MEMVIGFGAQTQKTFAHPENFPDLPGIIPEKSFRGFFLSG
jgi:hypothetical protein